MNIRIQDGIKYKVVIRCLCYPKKDLEKPAYVLNPGEEYTVDCLYEINSIAYVSFGGGKIICLDLFKNCFEQVSS